ncbi:ABC transporter permease [Polaromonas sp.]|uniref:ABC transporter permease n=1 Tax=Polaromonas sp. TaxID=1869339 RepID=UPI0032641C25
MRSHLSHLRNLGVPLILVATYLFFSIAAPSFFGFQNLVELLHVVAPIAICASGMALVVIAGRLDVSVGSIAYVASAVFALLLRADAAPLPLAVAAAIGCGVVLGLINALVVCGLGINSLIATLGTMIAFRGFGLWLTNGGLIELPEAAKNLGNAAIGAIYVDTLVATALLLLIDAVHRRTAFGRQLTAIGNGEDVARRIGIPVQRRISVSLVISGVLAATAGVMYTMQVAVNTAKIGEGMEFTAVAAIVVGGISLFGGRGKVLASVLIGSLIFQVIRSGLQQFGANPYSYRLVEGVVIFIAMYADALKVGRRPDRTQIPKGS